MALVLGAPRLLPACASLCFHLLVLLLFVFPKRRSFQPFHNRPSLAGAQTAKRGQNQTLLHRTKSCITDLALSFPWQAWLCSTRQLTRVSGDSPESVPLRHACPAYCTKGEMLRRQHPARPQSPKASLASVAWQKGQKHPFNHAEIPVPALVTET